MDSRDPATPDGAIAIIGMAGRFPKAKDLAEYWANLRGGVEAITFFTPDELAQAGVDPELIRDPDYVPARSFMEGAELFDAAFFDFNPREAEVLDPQHRLFLECAFQALEDASYAGRASNPATGVFAGAGGFDSYLLNNLYSNPEVFRTLGAYQVFVGNANDFLATRVSYKLDLRGPSTTVQTACSTSLVAIHMACQALLGFQCDMAIAGGVRVTYPQRRGYLYQEGMILSPDGHCRPFDSRAQGIVPGEGVGAVVLRRLDEALADGDHIHAVIRGSALNNDGSNKVGYSAPSVDGQVDAILTAQALAEVHPEDISYIEAHGTATPVGDPIEVRALTTAFRSRTEKTGYCAIGSVKSNIGHADIAAGVAGLIKTVLSLQNEEIAPSLHYETPNPEAELERSPFFVNDRLRPWPRGERRRVAGVSSFGLGGTNVHMIVEEAPAREQPPTGRAHRLLCLSARTASALDAQTSNLADAIRDMTDASFADATYTAHVGRKAFEYRRFTVAQHANHAAEALESLDPERIFDGRPRSPDRPVAFMFAGGGAQFPGMGEALYRSEPRYREIVDECHAILEARKGLDLKSILYPEDRTEEIGRELQRPSKALPALFTTQLAMATLLIDVGVEPRGMIGHSMGEYVAACLAGTLTLEDGLLLVLRRGELFETLPRGAMLSVPLPAEEVRPFLGTHLSFAAVNAPTHCVVAGPEEAIEELRATLEEQDVESRRLRISVAAHSEMVEPILGPFREFVEQIDLRPPERPFVSNLSGQWIRPEEATNPEYWVRHLRQTVRFSEGVEKLLEDENLVLLEVGPGRTLSSLARQHPGKAPAQLVLTSMRHPNDEGDDASAALTCLGRLWLTGVEVDWERFYAHERRHRTPLPPYPFERQRFWIEPGERLPDAPRAETEIRKNPDLAAWFHVPTWKQAPLPGWNAAALGGGWLVIHDGDDLAGAIVDRLGELDQDVVEVVAGSAFARRGPSSFTIDPRHKADHAALLASLGEEGRAPRHIVHLLNVTPATDVVSAKQTAFYSLLALAQALAEQGRDEPVDLLVVSTGVHAVDAVEPTQPEKALLLGPTRGIPLELPFVSCRSVDLPSATSSDSVRARLVDALLSEATDGVEHAVVAYRGFKRLVQSYEAVHLEKDTPPRIPLREGGTYLITGGMSGIGRTLATHVARGAARVRLALLGRERSAPEDLRHELEQLGAEVLFLEADVSSTQEMAGAVGKVRERFGEIHGVVHGAGVLRDGSIELKEHADVERVFAPKVEGTLVLDRLVADDPLDFFVLCSAATAATGSPAQIDYVAANAFQNAFASAKAARNGVFTVAIGWGTWRDIGLAARTGRSLGLDAGAAAPDAPSSPPGEGVDHPLLERKVQRTADRVEFETQLAKGRHWALDEHQADNGIAFLPGTAYLELVRAAAGDVAGLELRDVLFLAPCAVAEHDSRELVVSLEQEGDRAEFTIRSRDGTAGGVNADWLEHVTGSLAPLDANRRRSDDLAEIRGRCRDELSGPPASERMRLGPRWQCLHGLVGGPDEALATLELGDEFESDLSDYRLHPALLDVATGCAQALLTDRKASDLYVALSYGALRLHGPLPRKLLSHVRHRRDKSEPGEIEVFDATLMDEDGKPLVEVEEFAIRRIEDAQFAKGNPSDAGRRTTSRRSSADGPAAAPEHESALAIALREGILPEEGAEAFARTLARGLGPEVLVLPIGFPALRRLVQPAGSEVTSEGEAEEGSASSRHARPDLATPFVAPRTELEVTLSEIWMDMLGLDRVGSFDDFFELGGHSLLFTQILARVRKKVGVQLAMREVLDKPTIARVAEKIDEKREADADAPRAATPRLSRVARRAYRAKDD